MRLRRSLKASLMKPSIVLYAAIAALLAWPSVYAAEATATPADLTFVGKVSEGGMYEVEAGELAEAKAGAQDIRDFATMEVHDHTLVGDKLKSISSSERIALPTKLNPEFQGKLDHLKTLSGPSFDRAYLSEMATLHATDGAAFAKEGEDGGSAAFRSFGKETHVIVQRHIGAINAAPAA